MGVIVCVVGYGVDWMIYVLYWIDVVVCFGDVFYYDHVWGVGFCFKFVFWWIGFELCGHCEVFEVSIGFECVIVEVEMVYLGFILVFVVDGYCVCGVRDGVF